MYHANGHYTVVQSPDGDQVVTVPHVRASAKKFGGTRLSSFPVGAVPAPGPYKVCTCPDRVVAVTINFQDGHHCGYASKHRIDGELYLATSDFVGRPGDSGSPLFHECSPGVKKVVALYEGTAKAFGSTFAVFSSLRSMDYHSWDWALREYNGASSEVVTKALALEALVGEGAMNTSWGRPTKRRTAGKVRSTGSAPPSVTKVENNIYNVLSNEGEVSTVITKTGKLPLNVMIETKEGVEIQAKIDQLWSVLTRVKKSLDANQKVSWGDDTEISELSDLFAGMAHLQDEHEDLWAQFDQLKAQAEELQNPAETSVSFHAKAKVANFNYNLNVTLSKFKLVADGKCRYMKSCGYGPFSATVSAPYGDVGFETQSLHRPEQEKYALYLSDHFSWMTELDKLRKTALDVLSKTKGGVFRFGTPEKVFKTEMKALLDYDPFKLECQSLVQLNDAFNGEAGKTSSGPIAMHPTKKLEWNEMLKAPNFISCLRDIMTNPDRLCHSRPVFAHAVKYEWLKHTKRFRIFSMDTFEAHIWARATFTQMVERQLGKCISFDWPIRTGLGTNPVIWMAYQTSLARKIPKFFTKRRLIVDQTQADTNVWEKPRTWFCDVIYESYSSPDNATYFRREILASSLNLDGRTRWAMADGKLYRLDPKLVDQLPSGHYLTNVVSSYVYRSILRAFYRYGGLADEKTLAPLLPDYEEQSGDDQQDILPDEGLLRESELITWFESFGVMKSKVRINNGFVGSEFLGKKVAAVCRDDVPWYTGKKRTLYLPLPTRPWRMPTVFLDKDIDPEDASRSYLMETMGLLSFDVENISQSARDWFKLEWYPMLDAAYAGLEEALGVSDEETKVTTEKVTFEAHSLRATSGDKMSKKEQKEVHHIAQVIDKLAQEMKSIRRSKEVSKKTHTRVKGDPDPLDDGSTESGIRAAASVFYPELVTNPRVPDEVTVATATNQTVDQFQLTTLNSPGPYEMIIAVKPALDAQISYSSAFSSGICSAKTDRNNVGYSSLSGIASYARVVSCSITVACTSAALDLNGLWVAGNLPCFDGTVSGGGIVGTRYSTFSQIREFARGSFTPDKNSFRMVWIPGNPEDRDLEPVTDTIESDNTVMYVAISTSAAQALNINVVTNIEYIPISSAQQVIATQAVVADPSAYAKALNTTAQQAAMAVTTVTDPKEAVKPSNIGKMVSAVAGVAGKALSGDLIGAAKSAFNNAGDIVSGLKDGYNFISSAIGSWFGVSNHSDRFLHQLVGLGTLSEEELKVMGVELKTLIDRGDLPVEIGIAFKAVADLRIRPVHQYGRRIPKFCGFMWKENGTTVFGEGAKRSDRFTMKDGNEEGDFIPLAFPIKSARR